jgi:hypothetical protein
VIVDAGFVVLDVSEVAALGPSCVRRVRSLEAGNVSFLTHAIAWCYEDWCARQRLDDDGAPPVTVEA